MRTSFSAVTTSLLLAGTMTMAATASADGHETVESLKAELAAMQSRLDQTTAGRNFLSERLLEQADSSYVTQSELAATQSRLDRATAGRAFMSERLLEQAASSSDLQAELDSANEGRNYMAKRLEAMHADKYATSVTHASEVAKTKADADSVADVALVQIKSALAERDAAKAATAAVQNKNNFAAIMLKKAEGAAAAASGLRDELAGAKAANEKLASDMESVINGRSYIEKQVATAKKEASGLQEELAVAKAANEKLTADMESVINERTYSEIKAASDKTAAASVITDLESQLATAKGQLESAKAELSDRKDEAAKVEQSVNWSDNLYDSLNSQLSQLEGVEVAATRDNKVKLTIAGTGMFKSGSRILSSQGKNLLKQVGQSLTGITDASILITGHTDNIPTGADSSYKNNADLSNRRAEQAMNHLGSSASIDLARMSAVGAGDAQPITSNDTADGREMNRRVEITLSEK